MKHVKHISRRPQPAQYESLLQFIGLLNAILALFNSILSTLGLDIDLSSK